MNITQEFADAVSKCPGAFPSKMLDTFLRAAKLKGNQEELRQLKLIATFLRNALPPNDAPPEDLSAYRQLAERMVEVEGWPPQSVDQFSDAHP